MPLYTFLAWIVQIVSYFDFERECFLDELLLRLATKYPSAVIYSFQLAYNSAIDSKSTVRPIVQQILNAIKNPTLERFITNINCLSLPDKVMEYHLKNVYSRPKQMARNLQELQICYENVYGTVRGRSANKFQVYKSKLEEIMQFYGMKNKPIFNLFI